MFLQMRYNNVTMRCEEVFMELYYRESENGEEKFEWIEQIVRMICCTIIRLYLSFWDKMVTQIYLVSLKLCKQKY